MKFLRKILDRIEPNFIGSGKFSKFYPIFEATDTFLFSPSDKANNPPYFHDAIDIKRVMFFVVIAMIPTLLFGIFKLITQFELIQESCQQ